MQVSSQINVSVQTQYLSEHASEENQFPFAYKITITNTGEQMVQLINRYWLITDGNGKKTEVHGAGVVGKQPYIKQGKSFVYTSGAVLETPIGTMQGYYEMQNEKGDWFQAPIEVFSLSVPNILN
ncbi:Co2+/Mg2+ efflux protein ApaG [Paraglaciecola aquimarina]|uniref:Protein ApaG n=1 Tax=Paraglaciecola aquimarina TaxID=1235557 RepID=A0ABU3SW21_9ALTE|nr:Co2+/Mg2+ efflux protein ApaG [Paraglaciecola aquimarina]MDU0354224.1 Co2+/Mg2+ efflux protein ApaG [Paraglaciecola aquimarina]